MNSSKSYDNWKLDTGEKSSPVVYRCICGCNEEVLQGELVWSTLDGYVLLDHWNDYAVKQFQAKQIYAEG